MKKWYIKHCENISKFILGILATIAYAIGLARHRARFIEILQDFSGWRTEPLLTEILFIKSPTWAHLVINCTLMLLLVLTWVFWHKRYRCVLLGLFAGLVVLYILLCGIALYLPKTRC